MSTHRLDFLERIGRHLWRLVIIESSFKAGSYLLAVSVILLLAARVFGISFLAESYLLFLSPVIGLLVGAAIGLFNKPSLADVALVVDSKFGSDNYFSTAYECSVKSSPNPVEDKLVKDMAGPGSKAARDFAFRYNRRYFYLFLILSGMMLIIWFTPVAQRLPVADINQVTGSSVFDSDIITISQGLSGIKQNQANPQEINEIIRQVEALIQNIRDNRQDKTLVLETIDGFIRKLSDAAAPPAESAKLQSLLSQLESLVGGSIAVAPGVKQDGTGKDEGFSVYQPRQGTTEPGRPMEKYDDKKVEINPGIVVKSREEAINNPYLPGEYKEIIKKYFQQK